MLEPEIESRSWDEQLALDDEAYRAQLAYLLERSAFYRDKLGSEPPRGLAEIAGLPFTEKQELRETVTPENPIGSHLCATREEVVRIYSTSGTTGAPSYIPLTAGDLDNWVTASARSYAASGVTAGQRIVSSYNAGPFVAGAALAAFDRIGLCHIPVGTGNTERLVGAVQRLKPEAVVVTPSYAAYLLEWAEERGIDLAASTVERVLVAGEPGGGEASVPRQAGGGVGRQGDRGDGDRRRRPIALGRVRGRRTGCTLRARGFAVFPELIDPESGAAVELAAGASGALVRTHQRHRAAPLLRFRTRDHLEVRTSPCSCGPHWPARPVHRAHRRHADRARRQRLPSALREVVSGFAPKVSGNILVRPAAPGVKQDPPLPVAVELAQDACEEDGLAEAIRARLRTVLVVQTSVDLVPFGSLERSEAKSKLVERELRCGRSRLKASTTSRLSAPTARRRSDSGKASSACRSCSSSRTSTTRPRATSTSIPGDGRLITVVHVDEDRTPDSARTATDPGCVHHIAVNVSPAVFKQAAARLEERGVKHSGVKDRGFMDSIYFEDPLGLTIELAAWRFEPPYPFTHAEVLLEAHKLRTEMGDDHIGEAHLADAIELLVRTLSRETPLQKDRSPQNPY